MRTAQIISTYHHMMALKTIGCITLFMCSMTLCSDVKLRFRPRWHLAPPNGWMNDPNGFVFFKGIYHCFYQHNPLSSQEPGIAHWGHAVSRDLYHWKHLPIALYPDTPYDRSGVFSGSAVVENNTLFLFYTGNVNNPGLDPDHKQTQNLAHSVNGVTFQKYEGNPLILAPKHQPNIRDPKVWYSQQTKLWYMVLGSQNGDFGRVLLYYSEDLVNWSEGAVLAESTGFLGYMWECPDFFELDGKFVLMFSPQGVLPEGDSYRNLYQTGYIVGDFSYENLKFTPITSFVELDYGHDFYAVQTTLNEKSQRIMLAWFDMWEQVYPERNDGWTGHLTMPRLLSLDDNYKIRQNPMAAVSELRYTDLTTSKNSITDGIQLEDNSAEITVEATRTEFLLITLTSDSGTIYIAYEPENGRVTFDRGETDGVRRAYWTPKGSLMMMRIFIDASSIEIFLGDGEATISSRIFPTTPIIVRLAQGPKDADVKIVSLFRSVPIP